jgi:hypothetical protein
MATRRQFLKVGVAGAALLIVVRAAYGPFSGGTLTPEDGGHTYGSLGLKDRTVLAGLVPVMLAGALPEDQGERERAVIEVIRGVDQAVSGLPPGVQGEVAQLFALLGFPLTRRLLARVWNPWLEAGPDTVQRFLERWRSSSFALLRSAYAALHELVMAAWYGNPAAWPRIGYPGPPTVVVNERRA